MDKRPDHNRNLITTPLAATILSLLGGVQQGPLTLTRNEFSSLQMLYEFTREKPNERPAPLVPPSREDFEREWEYTAAEREYEVALLRHAKWEDPKDFLQAGADRNTIRHAEADGLRMVAWLAKYLPAGYDPLKQLVQLAVTAGLDVDPEDVTWADSEE